MRKVIPLIFSGMMAIVLALGCGGGELNVDEAYSVLRPVKQLELPDQVEDNLIVTIDNVADESSSYKNRIELYINGRRVNPNWLVSNVEKTFTYKLRLRPGYYEVKAYYYAYIGWGEERYEIETQELVRVAHDQRTTVSCNIAKQPNGEPVNRNMYFKTRNQPIAAAPAAPVVRPEPVVAPEPVTRPTRSQEIVLQVNTTPVDADVYVDDLNVGRTPARVPVDRSLDHTVQLSAPGYRSAVKFLDHSFFRGKKTIHIIQELERID